MSEVKVYGKAFYGWKANLIAIVILLAPAILIEVEALHWKAIICREANDKGYRMEQCHGTDKAP